MNSHLPAGMLVSELFRHAAYFLVYALRQEEAQEAQARAKGHDARYEQGMWHGHIMAYQYLLRRHLQCASPKVRRAVGQVIREELAKGKLSTTL